MTTEEIIGFSLAFLVMMIGIAGAFLPGIPSTPLVLGAAIVHKLYFGSNSVGWITMTLLVAITLLALVMDYLATVVGAKKFGAEKKGMIGAIVGGLVGLFFNLPGLLFGPFIGATLFEMMGGREFKPAMKAGVGATLGLFLGAAGKVLCCGAMTVLFTVNVLWRTLN